VSKDDRVALESVLGKVVQGDGSAISEIVQNTVMMQPSVEEVVVASDKTASDAVTISKRKLELDDLEYAERVEKLETMREEREMNKSKRMAFLMEMYGDYKEKGLMSERDFVQIKDKVLALGMPVGAEEAGPP
jgi:hypothetical protein